MQAGQLVVVRSQDAPEGVGAVLEGTRLGLASKAPLLLASAPSLQHSETGVPVMVVSERVQSYGPDGKLITESLKDHTRRQVTEEFASLDDFLRTWSDAAKKNAVIRELRERSVLFEAQADEVGRATTPSTWSARSPSASRR